MTDQSIQKIYKIGNLFILGMKLQGYFLWKLISGGIILGIFPALLGLYRLIYQYINDKNNRDIKILTEMRKSNKKEFWQINGLGFLFLIGSGILFINLNISRQYFQNGLYHLFLLMFLGLYLGASHFVIPIFAKYELPLKQYIYQAFLFFLINILETIAIILGVTLSLMICFLVPIVGFLTGIPLILTPYVWFSKAAVEKAEIVFYVEES